MGCRYYCIEVCVCAIVSHTVAENEASGETDGAEGGDGGDPAGLPARALYVHEDDMYVGLHLHHFHRSSMQRKTMNLVETNATAQRSRVGGAGLAGDGDNISASTVSWD